MYIYVYMYLFEKRRRFRGGTIFVKVESRWPDLCDGDSEKPNQPHKIRREKNKKSAPFSTPPRTYGFNIISSLQKGDGEGD